MDSPLRRDDIAASRPLDGIDDDNGDPAGDTGPPAPPDRVRRRLALVGTGVLTGLLLLLVVVMAARSRPAAVVVTPASATVAAPVSTASAAPASRPAPATITVHVAGAVGHSGLVRLEAKARVADAVAAAGGPSTDADVDAINLARTLSDGERVVVPRRGDPAPPAGGAAGTTGTPVSAPAEPIDLNTASTDRLEILPGVGPALAQRIVEHRPYREVHDLLTVPGIGEKLFARLQALVTVAG
jgi:competence protein ComEA